MESEWKSQNEIRFYELSSHQDWEPTAILKIKGKNPDSYSKWIKGFRQNLKGNRGGLTMEVHVWKIFFKVKLKESSNTFSQIRALQSSYRLY